MIVVEPNLGVTSGGRPHTSIPDRNQPVDTDHLAEAILAMSRFFHKLTPSSTDIGSLTLRQYEAVDEIGFNPGISLNTLAEQLGLANSTTSQLVDRLVRDGYLDRQTNPKNRREINIRLSAKGQEYLQVRKEAVQCNLGTMLESLSAVNRARFMEALHLIGVVIREHKTVE